MAKTFADFSVIPIPVSGNLPLKYHISVATNEILAVNKEKESQNILKVLSILIAFSGLSTVQRIERDATYRYKVLTIENEQASSCLNVNNRLIFRHDLNELVNLDCVILFHLALPPRSFECCSPRPSSGV